MNIISIFYFLFLLCYYYTFCQDLNINESKYINIDNMNDIENIIEGNLTEKKKKNIYENELELFNQIEESSQKHIEKLSRYMNYYDFIKGLSYSFPLLKEPSKNISYLNPKKSIYLNECKFFHSVQIKHLKEKQHLLICINQNISSISIYNVTSLKINYLSSIKLSLEIDINDTKVSFSVFEEDNSVIFLSNNQVYIIFLQINFAEGIIYIPTTQKFFIDLLGQTKNNMIFYDAINYHLNRYLVIAYDNGEILVYLCKTNSIVLKTHISFPSKIDKLFLKEGLLFIVNDLNKITVLTLLGGNSILIVCNNYYPILDIIYDHINSLMYILDLKGRVIIKNLKVNLNKVYSNECETLYQVLLPKYSLYFINDTKLNFLKGEVFIKGKNYLGFLNKHFELENYFIRNDLISNDKMFEEGKSFYLYTFFQNKLIIYKIDINHKRYNSKRKNHENLSNKKDNMELYNDFKPVECNGNLLCKILFNTYTNNKNTTFYFYIIAILIVVLSVYFYNKRRQSDLQRFKEFEENRIKGNQETNNKLQEMLGQIKHLEKFENYQEYKKRERKPYNEEEEKNPFSSHFNDNEIQYHGDDDDDDDDELNEELKYFDQHDTEQMRAYHNYVNRINKEEDNFYPRKYHSDDDY